VWLTVAASSPPKPNLNLNLPRFLPFSLCSPLQPPHRLSRSWDSVTFVELLRADFDPIFVTPSAPPRCAKNPCSFLTRPPLPPQLAPPLLFPPAVATMDNNMEIDTARSPEPHLLSPTSDPGSIPTLDGWIESLMTCKQLAEEDVRRLCDRVRCFTAGFVQF
jgi:hypothetical protein